MSGVVEEDQASWMRFLEPCFLLQLAEQKQEQLEN